VGLRFVLLLAAATGATAQSLPDGAGKDLVQVICTTCHSTERIVAKHMTKAEWQAKVLEMLQEEPDVTQPERDQIADYLARSFPPAEQLNGNEKLNVNEATARDLATALQIPSEQADAIVEYRKQKGNFKTLEDLKRVPGLDAAKVEAHKDRLTFSD
jgi:competence protein ComEA